MVIFCTQENDEVKKQRTLSIYRKKEIDSVQSVQPPVLKAKSNLYVCEIATYSKCFF